MLIATKDGQVIEVQYQYSRDREIPELLSILFPSDYSSIIDACLLALFGVVSCWPIIV